ncbi:hypothetical protein BC830DRAFT_1170655 [Chytriomyces sp. MP71]|nr:hypothetical protein BC830DRAFT_1170655 [Chytriomyces sp. MP71]
MLAEVNPLDAFLSARHRLEHESVTAAWRLSLARIAALLNVLVRNAARKQGIQFVENTDFGERIVAFGSFRLGVHSEASDIDALCLIPKHVKRDDFFHGMVDLLRGSVSISNVKILSDAHVPIIKLTLDGVEIDLLCARFFLEFIPRDLDLSNVALRENLDERCLRSLHGTLVTEEILRLVPHLEAFRAALRFIKFWAKTRAIYSSAMGYAAESPGLWLLLAIDFQEDGSWNPSANPEEAKHPMPILTPAKPFINCTQTMTKSTFAVTMIEILRAAEILNDPLEVNCWETLAAPHDFFSGRYKHYVQVVARSWKGGKECHFSWSGFIESRLRILVLRLEAQDAVSIAQPFNRGFSPDPPSLADVTSNEVNDHPDPVVITTTFYIGFHLVRKDKKTKSARTVDLSRASAEFINTVKNWSAYDDGAMALEKNSASSATSSIGARATRQASSQQKVKRGPSPCATSSDRNGSPRRPRQDRSLSFLASAFPSSLNAQPFDVYHTRLDAQSSSNEATPVPSSPTHCRATSSDLPAKQVLECPSSPQIFHRGTQRRRLVIEDDEDEFDLDEDTLDASESDFE